MLSSPGASWKRSISSDNQQQLSSQAMERHGEGWAGALPHRETAEEQKLQLGPRLATSGENAAALLQISPSYKDGGEPNFGNGKGHQVELRSDCDLPTREEPDLRYQSFPILFPISGAPHIS